MIPFKTSQVPTSSRKKPGGSLSLFNIFTLAMVSLSKILRQLWVWTLWSQISLRFFWGRLLKGLKMGFTRVQNVELRGSNISPFFKAIIQDNWNLLPKVVKCEYVSCVGKSWKFSQVNDFRICFITSTSCTFVTIETNWMIQQEDGRYVKFNLGHESFKVEACFLSYFVHPGNLTWQWKNQPFEDVSPIQHCDFPFLSC